MFDLFGNDLCEIVDIVFYWFFVFCFGEMFVVWGEMYEFDVVFLYMVEWVYFVDVFGEV